MNFSSIIIKQKGMYPSYYKPSSPLSINLLLLLSLLLLSLLLFIYFVVVVALL